jgi:hypothetical protein
VQVLPGQCLATARVLMEGAGRGIQHRHGGAGPTPGAGGSATKKQEEMTEEMAVKSLSVVSEVALSPRWRKPPASSNVSSGKHTFPAGWLVPSKLRSGLGGKIDAVQQMRKELLME